LLYDPCSEVGKEISEKCANVDMSWPQAYSRIIPEPSQVEGKWWWYRGQVLDGGLVSVPSQGTGTVYRLWRGIASGPPGPPPPGPTPTP
jgi:hypothetical protein